MNQIKDAILAGDTSATTSAVSRCPSPTAPCWCARTSRTCSRAWPTKDKDPRKSLHVEEVPTPELGPGEALVAVMASRSTTTPSGRRSSSRSRRSASSSATAACPTLTKRHDLPYHVVGSDLAGVVLRGRPRRQQVEARGRGRRALPVGGAGGPGRPRRHDDGPAAADLGLRDQLRRPGRAGAGQEQPADAQARPPHLGGGRRPGAGQLPPPTASWSATTAPT